jgi:hypothetical protein
VVDDYFVMIKCPNTGKGVRTGVELPDMASFQFVGLLPEEVACPHCPEIHTWSNKDAWMERHGASRVHVRPAIANPRSEPL